MNFRDSSAIRYVSVFFNPPGCPKYIDLVNVFSPAGVASIESVYFDADATPDPIFWGVKSLLDGAFSFYFRVGIDYILFKLIIIRRFCIIKRFLILTDMLFAAKSLTQNAMASRSMVT